MAMQQNFRSAFNGFNREDVVHYLEYINARHTAQVNQLTAEIDQLRHQLAQRPEDTALTDAQAQAAHWEARCAELEQQLEARSGETAGAVCTDSSSELEAYRRAERTEREARERAELVYYQANSVLSEATAKVDGLAAEITDMADQVMAQLTQLQMAVSSSKQALQDAASIMNTIRPNK